MLVASDPEDYVLLRDAITFLGIALASLVFPKQGARTKLGSAMLWDNGLERCKDLSLLLV